MDTDPLGSSGLISYFYPHQYLYIYIIEKVKFPKTYTIVNALYKTEFYYLVHITLKLYMLRMTQTIFLRKYIGIDNDVLKKECFQIIS